MRLAHVLVCHTINPSRCLESIEGDVHDPWYVFLHSNDEQVESVVLEDSKRRGSTVFSYKYNRGLAKSWNDAVHLAMQDNCDAVLFLNDDLFFYPDGYTSFRDEIARVLAEKTPLVYITLRGMETGESALAGQVHPQGFACCAVPKSTFECIGYFDETFAPAYFEDVDYLRRGFLSGMDVHTDMRILAEHARSSTFRNVSAEQRAEWEQTFTKNMAYFREKWGGDSMTTAVFKHPFNRADLSLKIDYTDRATRHRSTITS